MKLSTTKTNHKAARLTSAKTLSIALIAALGLGACASNGPVDPNRGEMIATPGVREVFEDPNVNVAEAKEQIRCERITQTGSHMVKRYCYTVAEEDARNRANRDYLYNHWSRGACKGGPGAFNCQSTSKASVQNEFGPN